MLLAELRGGHIDVCTSLEAMVTRSRKVFTVVAAWASLYWAGQATATTSAVATISNMQIQLIDLDPNDGIAPSITYCGGAICGSSSFGGVYRGRASDVDKEQLNYSKTLFGNSAASVTSGPASAQASVFSGPNGLSLTVSGTAIGSGFAAGAFAVDNFSSFTLSNNTLLTITADASYSAALDGGRDTVYEEATVYFDFRLYGPDSDGIGCCQNSEAGGFTGIYAELFYDEEGNPQYVGSSMSGSGRMEISFGNVSGGDLGGSLWAGVRVTGVSNALPVPEPSTNVLLVAGLGVVGFLTRRRSQLPPAISVLASRIFPTH